MTDTKTPPQLQKQPLSFVETVIAVAFGVAGGIVLATFALASMGLLAL